MYVSCLYSHVIMQTELCKNTIDYTKSAFFMIGLASHKKNPTKQTNNAIL